MIKKGFSSQWRIIGFVFVQKCEHHDLSWKPAIQVLLLFGPDAGDHFFRTGFYWTLKKIILTVFFNNL